MSIKSVTFSGTRPLPAIGQGTWYMGEKASLRQTEVNALPAVAGRTLAYRAHEPSRGQ
jgi:diketogulonate reductase-like aldo/keto reductase